jgi:hypothetical protein
MADPNHVRALVAPAPPGAVAYYKAYKFEPSRTVADDMIIDEVVDLTAHGRSVDLLVLLEQLKKAARDGFQEVLLVGHGNEKGLIMNVGVPKMGAANQSGLRLVRKVEEILAKVATIRGLPNPQDRRTRWRALITELSGKPFGDTGHFGSRSSRELEPVNDAGEPRDDAYFEKILFDMAPDAAGASILKNRQLLRLLELRKQVVSPGLKRLEIRACNIVQDAGGTSMKELREFIGVRRLLAPLVYTFFNPMTHVQILTDAQFSKKVRQIAPGALANNSPIRWFTCGLKQVLAPLAGPGPAAVSYPPVPKGAPDISCYVRYAQDKRLAAGGAITGSFAWGITPHDNSSVRLFVYELLDLNGKLNYQKGTLFEKGTFIMGGFDALYKRTSPPPEANNKALVLPSDPEYRNLIVESS